jgi:hypothetical protein
MPKNGRCDKQFFLSKGFEEGADGVWRKKNCTPQDPASRADPKPHKNKPKRGKEPQSKRAANGRIIAIVTVRTVRPRDYDGLGASSKHYLDALRHCGLFEDDAPEYFECLAVSERVRSFCQEETIIELFQLPKQ